MSSIPKAITGSNPVLTTKNKIMIYFIITGLLIVFSFIGMLLYKLSDVRWFHQFMTQKFEDKDVFTRLVKFLMM